MFPQWLSNQKPTRLHDQVRQILNSQCSTLITSRLYRLLVNPVYMPNVTPFRDVLRFFHGDHPAQQFEAGNKKGGYYPYVMCEGRASRFDDLVYCYRCETISLLDRKRFILAGTSWKDRSKPFQGLKLPDIHRELESRGINATGKLQNQLDESLDELHNGIAQFPALVQPNSQDTLDAINLQHGEIATVESLHDFKSHMVNLFDLPFLLTGNALKEVTKIKESVLHKNTMRCVDYRKATILLSQALRTTEVSENMRMIADTAVQICEILYTREDRRSPRSILHLHNLTYLYGRLCSNAIHNPRSITKQNMFGHYYHSLTYHSAKIYQLISLRFLHTDFQERTLFGQANSITRQTSSNHPQHIINNAIRGIQAESSHTIQTISQDGGLQACQCMGKFAQYPDHYWVYAANSLEFQSHLKGISDFLLLVPGVWWRHTPSGIKFLDGPTEESARREGPMLQHLGSVTCNSTCFNAGRHALTTRPASL